MKLFGLVFQYLCLKPLGTIPETHALVFPYLFFDCLSPWLRAGQQSAVSADITGKTC